MTVEVFATNIDAGGTDLRWSRFTPISGGPTWPAAVVLHAGGFKTGNRGPGDISQDLANAGFLTFAAEYRLAPPHTPMNSVSPGDGQQDPPSDGRPPQQTDDVRRAIRAARADSQCSGKVVIVGCSAGGSHGAWWGIAGTADDDKPDAVVALSGIHDLDNSAFLSDSHNLSDVQNYLDHLLTEGTPFHNAAKDASPYWLTVGATPTPMLLFNSTSESVDPTVLSTMVTKLTNAGGTIESHLRTGTEHAGAYWYLGYGGAFSSVKDCSIDFLGRMLTVTPVQIAPAYIQIRRK